MITIDLEYVILSFILEMFPTPNLDIGISFNEKGGYWKRKWGYCLDRNLDIGILTMKFHMYTSYWILIFGTRILGYYINLFPAGEFGDFHIYLLLPF